MKSLKSSLLAILILFTACQQKMDAPPKEKSTINPTSIAITASYHPPIFEQKDRTNRVKQLAPQIHELIEKQSKERKIPGIAYGIVVDDSLVVAGATGLMNLETKQAASINKSFRIASMSKSFTAMAILKLKEDGKLKLSDPVAIYIPEMAKLRYLSKDAPIITINNLLTMTAGFPEDNPWGDRQLDESNEMLIGLVKAGLSFSNVPSFQYEYSNTGYALLGNLVARISGMPYQEYIRKNIFEPLGMKETYWEFDNIPKEDLVLGYRWEDEQWKKEPMLHDGSFGCMGGLFTSITDFSKYVQYHLSAYPPKNEVAFGPVKRSTLRAMHTPQYPRLYATRKDYTGEVCPALSGYGFGLGITKDCKGVVRVRHGGALPGFGSSYVFYPDYGVGIMAFGNLTYTGPLPTNEFEKLLFETARLEKRKLPVSDILAKRKEQIISFIKDWNPTIESEIIAENFYLDKSKEHRKAAIQAIFEKAGKIQKVKKLIPFNQLRGRFDMQAENGVITVFFTLSPEKDPKVQRLDMRFEEA